MNKKLLFLILIFTVIISLNFYQKPIEKEPRSLNSEEFSASKPIPKEIILKEINKSNSSEPNQTEKNNNTSKTNQTENNTKKRIISIPHPYEGFLKYGFLTYYTPKKTEEKNNKEKEITFNLENESYYPLDNNTNYNNTHNTTEEKEPEKEDNPYSEVPEFSNLFPIIALVLFIGYKKISK